MSLTRRPGVRTAGRFVIAGGANTLVTGLLLAVLSIWLDQRVAFTIVFSLGVLLSLVLAGRFVFRSRITPTRATAFALVYASVYLVGLGVTTLMMRSGLPAWATGAVVLVTAPLSFLGSSLVFGSDGVQESVPGQAEVGSAGGPLADEHALVHVVVLMVILGTATFWSYFTGAGAPQWDFLAGYLTEAFAWWNRGGIASPPEWLSYAWMGYPADSDLQNSSYYLPVGMANAISLYTPQVAAVLAAAHVGFGALGCYLLARSLTSSHLAGLLALVGGFFSVGFFSNAQHVDIARGVALLPWLALSMSPLWRWGKWWSVPGAAVIVWQFAVGAYPGQLVAVAYALPVWVLAWLVAQRKSEDRWFLQAVIAAVGGLLLSLAKFGPALALGAGHVNTGPQSVVVSPVLATTIFFPYDDPNLPNDISMRSYFLLAPVVVLIGLAAFGRLRQLPVVAIGAVAGLFTIATELADDWVRLLPGMSLSRFRTVDFKPILLMALLLLAASGAARIGQGRGKLNPAQLAWLVMVPLAAALLSSATAISTPLRAAIVYGTIAIVIASSVVAWTGSRATAPGHRRLVLFGLIGLGAFSGLIFAYSVQPTWVADRADQEVINYGTPAEVILARSACAESPTQRPAREVPAVPMTELFRDTVSLTGAFDCSEWVGGYINVKGNPVRVLQNDLLIADSTGYLLRFYSAPGAVVPVVGGAVDPKVSDACLFDGQCDGMNFRPRDYSRGGSISYLISAERPMTVALNESYYQGWDAQTCTGTACVAAPVAPGPDGSIFVEIPAGDFALELQYSSPSRELWFIVARLGLVLLVATCFTVGLRSHVRSWRAEGNAPRRVAVDD